eukprot:4094592-Alexandrium_andersonii.AAC.1
MGGRRQSLVHAGLVLEEAGHRIVAQGEGRGRRGKEANTQQLVGLLVVHLGRACHPHLIAHLADALAHGILWPSVLGMKHAHPCSH